MQSLNKRLGSTLFSYVVDLFTLEEINAVLEKHGLGDTPVRVTYDHDERNHPAVLVYTPDSNLFYVELDTGGRLRCYPYDWEMSGTCDTTFFYDENESIERQFVTWLDSHLAG